MQNVSDEEWKKKLTPEQYRILRKKETEPQFTGEYDKHFDKGMYMCAACGSKLFSSDSKFDANCGWPSFYDALPGSVQFHKDDRFGMDRTEVTCSNCGGHLGHVFEGEGFGNPTDQRYCINSLSLKFEDHK